MPPAGGVVTEIRIALRKSEVQRDPVLGARGTRGKRRLHRRYGAVAGSLLLQFGAALQGLRVTGALREHRVVILGSELEIPEVPMQERAPSQEQRIARGCSQ